MTNFSFSKAPISVKVFATAMLLGIAITYAILALHIYIDTEFNPSMIGEAYSGFEWIELTDQTHKYFPYYGIYIFAFAMGVFVLGTSFSEKLKVYLTIIPSVLIVVDIGSMWAIPYIHAGIFQWVLFFAGNFLALSFAVIFVLSMYDIWLRKK
jgi:hypothetical protein